MRAGCVLQSTSLNKSSSHGSIYIIINSFKFNIRKYHVAALIFFAKNNYNFYQRTGVKRKTRFHESFYTFCVYYVKFGNRGQLRRTRLAVENLGLLCLSVTEAELNQRENNEKRGEKQAGRYRAARESSNRASLSVSRLCIFRSRRETRKSG